MALLPACSVVICTRRRADLLDRCLEAVARLHYPSVGVVVVDNTPGDPRTHAAAQRWHARYLVEPVAGLSRARNTGARACSTEIVAFTDDDAVPHPDWLARIVEEFEDPDVTVVTGRTLPFAGLEREATADYTPDVGPHRIVLDRRHPYWFEMACFGGIGRGCNMAFRRKVFDDQAVFDERLGKGVLANADEHWAFGHLIAQGHKAIYTPEAVVRHPFPESVDQLRAWYLASLSDLTGYATFLLLNTGFRWKVAKYLLEAAMGTQRTWRVGGGAMPPSPVPGWRRLLAYGEGACEAFLAQLLTK